MARTKTLAVVATLGLAVGAIGCAHCDTCDDFPAPCLGGDCGAAAPAMIGPMPVMAGPAMIESAPMISTPAPAGQPGPFSAPAGGAAPGDSPPTPPMLGPNG